MIIGVRDTQRIECEDKSAKCDAQDREQRSIGYHNHATANRSHGRKGQDDNLPAVKAIREPAKRPLQDNPPGDHAAQQLKEFLAESCRRLVAFLEADGERQGWPDERQRRAEKELICLVGAPSGSGTMDSGDEPIHHSKICSRLQHSLLI